MSVFRFLTRLMVPALLAWLPLAAQAEMAPQPLPGDTRLVVFRYDPNNTYTIYTMPGAVTDIQLNDDEKLTALALGDTMQWTVAKTDGHVFVKPIKPGLFTSATLVTDKRSYQLTFRSIKGKGRWYQRVSWQYPQLLMLQQEHIAAEHQAEAKEKQRLDNINVSPNVAIENLNFDYTIKGDADFRPLEVFDDGHFTWMRVKVQEMPALFIMDEEGKTDLANYIVKGDYIVLERLAPMAVLKLGNQEVRITNNKLMASHHPSLFHWPFHW